MKMAAQSIVIDTLKQQLATVKCWMSDSFNNAAIIRRSQLQVKRPLRNDHAHESGSVEKPLPAPRADAHPAKREIYFGHGGTDSSLASHSLHVLQQFQMREV